MTEIKDRTYLMDEEPEPHRKIDMWIKNGTRVIFFCNAKEIKNEIQDPSRNPKIIVIDNIGSNTRDTIRQEIEQLFEDTQKKALYILNILIACQKQKKMKGSPKSGLWQHVERWKKWKIG